MAADVGNDVPLSTDEAINDSNEMVELLVSLGSDLNTAKTMMCLYVHGPSKSSDLQSRCDLRQPDVSISINKLKKLEIVRVVTSASRGRGRPSQIYELAVPLNQALIPFRNQAKEKLAILQNQLSRLSELVDSTND